MNKSADRDDGEGHKTNVFPHPLTIIITSNLHLQSVRFCPMKDTHGYHRNGLRWRPKRCFVERGGPSSPASCVVWVKGCTLLFDPLYSFGFIPQRVAVAVLEGRVIPPVKETPKLSAGHSHEVQSYGGTEGR